MRPSNIINLPHAKRTEHAEQSALFQWAEIKAAQYPELRLLFAIPNGGHRRKAVAAKLKAEGVKAGVSDIFLPVARMGYHGFFIEMKVAPNKPTALQLSFMACMDREGYLSAVCYGYQDAAAKIIQYLRG